MVKPILYPLLFLTVWLHAASLTTVHASEEAYNDTRRMGCMQALNAWTPEPVNDAAWPYLTDAKKSDGLEATKNRTSFLTRFANDTNSITRNYKNACDTAGGNWRVANTVLNCIDKRGKDSVTILVENGNCFPPGDECAHYVENINDWYIDTKAVFSATCVARDIPVEEAIQELISDDIPLPAGDPVFSPTNPDFDRTRHETCFSSYKQQIEDYEDLFEKAMKRAGKQQTELLQYSPVLTTREWYLDAEEVIAEYEEACIETGGTFGTFSGVVDCIGIGSNNRGEKNTQVIEGVTTCFPKDGCDGYTVGQWRVDTTMSLSSVSCNIRMDNSNQGLPSGQGGPTEDGSHSVPTGKGSTGSVGQGRVITLCVLGVACLCLVLAAVVYRHRLQKTQTASDEAGLPETYKDDTNEIPSMA